MRFNEKQMRHLLLAGLTPKGATATQAEAMAFYQTLSGEIQAQVNALADVELSDVPKSSTANGTDAVAVTSEDVKSAVAGAIKQEREAESNRVREIRAMATTYGLGDQFASEQIVAGASLEDARSAALQTLSERIAPVSGIAVGADRNVATIGTAISDAIMLRSGMALYETEPNGDIKRDSDGKPVKRAAHDRAQQMRYLSMHEIVRNYLGALGIDASGMSRAQVCSMVFNRRVMQQRASGAFALHSTSDFDAILADTINKSLRAKYAEWKPSWQQWCRSEQTADFKEISRTQLSASGTPPIVPEGGEYTYATKSDAKEVYRLKKYGQLFGISWEALINDDLRAFTRIPGDHLDAAMRIEDDLVYGILNANPQMADGQTLFENAVHFNNPSSAAISVTSLDIAMGAMRAQKGLKGEYIDVMPSFLIVPTTKEAIARQTIGSMSDPAKNNSALNPFYNRFEVIVNPRLNAGSTTAWYLAALPSNVDTIEVCFLEGMRMPQLTEEEGFEVDSRTYKVRHVVAAKAIDWRGLLKNAGA